MEPRVRTILKKLDANNSATGLQLYTPGQFNIAGTLVKGNGFINTLRVNCSIVSIPEVVLPPLDPAASAYEIDQRNKQLQAGNRKTLQVSIKDPSNTEYEVFAFNVFSTRPRYFADISLFLSDLEIYGIEYGYKLFIKAIDEGYGVLSGNDFIIIQGSCLETCSFLLTESSGVATPTVYDLLSVPS